VIDTKQNPMRDVTVITYRHERAGERGRLSGILEIAAMTIPNINADIIECSDRQTWLAERRKRIQASDASAILGQSAWGSPTSVYADKTAPALLESSTERQSIGLELEGPIASMYVRKFGGKVHPWKAHTIAVSREFPWLGCTPDLLLEDSTRPGVGLGEIKTASEFSRHEWEESAPLAYQIQVQASLLVLGLKWGAFAVLIGLRSVERLAFDRNDRFIDAMLPILQDFHTCLELRTPPECNGSAATTKALSRLHPADNGKAVHLPAGSDELIEKWKRADGLAKKLTDRADAIKNQLRAAIGDNTFGMTPGGAWVSWKSQTRKSFTVAESTSRVLRACKKPADAIEFVNDEANGVDFKVADRVQLPKWLKAKLLNQSNRCCWCGATLTLATATWEHRVPLSKGGTNDENNLALACAKCNHERGDDATHPVLSLA
jgi:predicted phage-related endonuclease